MSETELLDLIDENTEAVEAAQIHVEDVQRQQGAAMRARSGHETDEKLLQAVNDASSLLRDARESLVGLKQASRLLTSDLSNYRQRRKQDAIERRATFAHARMSTAWQALESAYIEVAALSSMTGNSMDRLFELKHLDHGPRLKELTKELNDG